MNRPEDIKDRLDNINEIGNIVSTLQAMATAHMLEVRSYLKAIRAHEANIASALSTALSLTGDGPPSAAATKGPSVAVVVGAAQGFCGGYSDRLAEAALAEAAQGGALIVIGSRTIGALAERGIAPIWAEEMAPRGLDVPKLATRTADAIFAHLLVAPDATVTILFAEPVGGSFRIVRRSMLPFDFSRFPPSDGKDVLTTLPVAALLGALVEEYVFAEVCEALMLGFAAENAARADTMARAKSNVSRIAAELKSEFHRARHEQTTAEIIELSAAKPAFSGGGSERWRAGATDHP